ncbi:MerR family regulatory protein [Pseudovibrio axinellae]|uniref:MerR family regulatory protein n=1 Tax=Pseudovibrio axinellae TaxID=989403 RepID=A0A165WNH4_9HYPH|nr:MerR family transcriptional regulator [Pseudovibrio axinellae]KZL16733.1 MerR family regulatory protein [Pseudovibrio axinellae]SEQ76860.1 MerR HTH family regulatory protein [Pseudovibrio axinellae]
MEKSADAFRTISEVASELDLPQHVLRFWETRFTQIRPLKRGGGRRYYRPDDLELLRGIRHLLYGEGYTIKGVQRILREQGVRVVMDVWKEGAGVVIPASASTAVPAGVAPDPSLVREGSVHSAAEAVMEQAVLVPARQVFEPQENWVADSSGADMQAEFPLEDETEPQMPLPSGLLPDDEPSTHGKSGHGAFGFMDRLMGSDRDEASGAKGLSKDNVDRLQSTLFELLECKRMLDQAR